MIERREYAQLLPRGVVHTPSLGDCLHDENGVNPRVSLSLWSALPCLPRLIYGLDVLKLSKFEIQKHNQKIPNKSSI